MKAFAAARTTSVSQMAAGKVDPVTRLIVRFVRGVNARIFPKRDRPGLVTAAGEVTRVRSAALTWRT